ncbi:hypothetical protein [Amycolatopsis sp. NBC_01480]|uniref:hypothetical protein n=1 Tax=Amycolatopsis sp. NBC_01480 TaxID=2903562 RepID=UPI002E28B013|nr:hypothetical protein [Amycolatopsis sp. NBC_01480]
MNARLLLDPQSAALPCENCGYTALHVARLVGDDGAAIGQTMVCTACHRQRQDDSSADGRIR